MGAEEFDGVIEASSADEAVRKYKTIAPMATYDMQCYCIMDAVVHPEVFEDASSAQEFLRGRIRKWDMKAGIVRCGDNRFAWRVLMPC